MKMSFIPEEFTKDGLLGKVVFVEAVWNTGAGTIGQISSVIDKLLMGAVSLKVFGVENTLWLIGIIGIVYVSGIFIFGYWLFKKNIIARRGNTANILGNPQLIKVEKALERIEEILVKNENRKN